MKTRTVLFTMVILGGAVTVLAGGVLAVFSDTAFTGPNRAESGPRGRPADLQLAFYNEEGHECGEFADDLTTGLVFVTDLQPGQRVGGAFCLRNAGSTPLAVTVRSVDVAGSETGCTGAEQDVDQSCGEGVGELGTVLYLERFALECPTGTSVGLTVDEFHASLQELQVHSAFEPLAAGSTACYRFGVLFRDADVSEEMKQAAQTDLLEWRFRFTGTSP